MDRERERNDRNFLSFTFYLSIKYNNRITKYMCVYTLYIIVHYICTDNINTGRKVRKNEIELFIIALMPEA